MKTLIASFLVLLSAQALVWGGPRQIKLDIRYEGVSAKWLTDVASLRDGKGVVRMPLSTTKTGLRIQYEFIQEYRTDPSNAESPAIQCGIITELTTKVEGNIIYITGTSIMRRPMNKKGKGTASLFEAQEVIVDANFESGKPKSIPIAEGGRMVITATLVESSVEHSSKIVLLNPSIEDIEHVAASDGDKSSK